MRVNSSVVVRAPRDAVWRTVTDPTAYISFMEGVTRWELDDGDPDERLTLGSRIRMLIMVGAAEVGGLIEIVECKNEADLAWSSVTGIDQRGRWRLRPAGQGLTRVELRFSYGVAGAGVTGLIAERVAAPILSRRMRRSLLGLKHRAEREYRQSSAAARRERAAA